MLIKTLVENNMVGVVYQTHMKNSELMKKLFFVNINMSENEADYMVSILANIIPACMNIWYQHGKVETPKEIYNEVRKSMKVI